MEIIQAMILGLVQGLGEFLPISSSAHLILVPYFFNFPDPGLSFDAVLHLGTLAALLAFFWRDWLKIIKRRHSTLLWWILLATLPGALAGYFFESYAETSFRSPLLLAGTLAVMAVVLWLSQKFAKPAPTGSASGMELVESELTFWKTIWIGIAQALAIVPGISRSGATMSAGMFLGLSKVSAARFSFLLSVPIVFGAGLFALKNMLTQPAQNIEWASLLTGFWVSALSGFLAIKFLLKWLEKADFKPFVIYRLLLAGAILLVLTLR